MYSTRVGPLAWPASPYSSEPDIDSKQLAAACAHLAEEKKGLDVRVYEVGQYLHVGDYFVVVTGTSRPHVKAIHQELHVRLKKMGALHGEPEGADMAWWVVLDYGTARGRRRVAVIARYAPCHASRRNAIQIWAY